jgi:hypothetical protein
MLTGAMNLRHVTCIRLILLKDTDGKHFRGLVQIDPLDDAIADGLKTLMTRDEEIPPGYAEEYAGLGQILSKTIYIVTYTWIVFLVEAEAHLQILVGSPVLRCYLRAVTYHYRARNASTRASPPPSSFNIHASYTSCLRCGCTSVDD